MAAISTRPWCSLSGLQVYNFSVANQVNGGVQWSATTPGWVGDPVTVGEATLAGTQTWSMVIGDGRGYVYTSPPLVACTGIRWVYSASGGEETQLTGTDLTTWKLSQPHQSLPTFRNLQANTIIDAISAASGVHIVAPQLNFSVAEEDVKQSNWWDPLNRIAEVAVSNWIIDASGSLRLVPLEWTGETVHPTPESVEYFHDPSKRVTGFVVCKRTSHHQATSEAIDRSYGWNSTGWKIQQLRGPIMNPIVSDRSTGGSCQTVGFWTANPNDPGSELVAFYPMGITITAMSVPVTAQNKAATYMALSVAAGVPPWDQAPIQARLEVSGSTPPTVEGAIMEGLDLSFTVTVGVISGPGSRPGPVRNESMYPSAQWVTARANGLLYEANKEASKVQISSAIDCSLVVGGRLEMTLPRTVPAARIERVEHSGSAEGFSSSASAYVIRSW